MFKKLADSVLGENWEEQLREQMFPQPPVQHDVRPDRVDRTTAPEPRRSRQEPEDEEIRVVVPPPPEADRQRAAPPMRRTDLRRRRTPGSARTLIGSGASLQQAIVLKEILDRPVALRDPSTDQYQ